MLVQISTGKNDAHIIQLDKENYNAPNLKKILEDKNINKIFHFARADLLFIKKYLEVDVVNVDCSKIASKLARTFSDKHGLKDLIKEFMELMLVNKCKPLILVGTYQKNNLNIVPMM